MRNSMCEGSEASSIDFEAEAPQDYDQTAEWKQELDEAFGRRQGTVAPAFSLAIASILLHDACGEFCGISCCVCLGVRGVES
jgi:hypothetical protein